MSDFDLDIQKIEVNSNVGIAPASGVACSQAADLGSQCFCMSHLTECWTCTSCTNTRLCH